MCCAFLQKSVIKNFKINKYILDKWIRLIKKNMHTEKKSSNRQT